MPTRSSFSKSDRPVWSRMLPRLVRLTVLAADKDFTLIAAITGQPIETLTD